MDKLGSLAHQRRLALWIDRIRACRLSGMTVNQWCRENDVGCKSYYYWLRKIRLEALEAYESFPASQPASALLPDATPAQIFAKVELDSGGDKNDRPVIVLDISGAKLQIHNAASEAAITNTLAAIRTITSGNLQC